LYLQSLRANAASIKDILQGERKTSKQSVLAAENWRSLTDTKNLFLSEPNLKNRNMIIGVANMNVQ